MSTLTDAGVRGGVGLTVEEALKNAEFAVAEDLRGAYPMATRVLADELRLLRENERKLEKAIQWLTDFRPESLQAGFWEAIGENDKAAEVRESQLDCSPIPGLPTNRQLAEWYK